MALPSPGPVPFRTDMPPPPPPAQPSTSAVAIVALVAGFASFVLPVVGSIAALILGVTALVLIGRSKGVKKGRGLAAIGMALSVVSAGGWIAILSSDEFQQGWAEGLQEVETSNLINLGACLDIPTGASDNFSVTPEQVVDCSEPHAAQYIGSSDLPQPPGAAHPGDDTVFDQGLDLCVTLFESFTGSSYADRPELELLVEFPDRIRWSTADSRAIACYIVSTDNSPLIGSTQG